MDARPEVCRRCGTDLPPARKLKNFCSYACRGQQNVLDAALYQSGLKGSKNTFKNKALQTLKRQSRGHITATRINPCTYRLDRAGKNGVGWILGVGGSSGVQRYVARVGHQSSKPTTLAAAKREAFAILRDKKPAKPRDWIRELNQAEADAVGRAEIERQRKRWPTELLGGRGRRGPRLKIASAVLAAEVGFVAADIPEGAPLSGDDQPLEYHPDGYPKLPAGLERRNKGGA